MIRVPQISKEPFAAMRSVTPSGIVISVVIVHYVDSVQVLEAASQVPFITEAQVVASRIDAADTGFVNTPPSRTNTNPVSKSIRNKLIVCFFIFIFLFFSIISALIHSCQYFFR
jgi:hypothetical protein